jgi:hypothetical protein
VSEALIDVSSLGESDLRVATGDNVFEPRNRRVEISVPLRGLPCQSQGTSRRRALGQWPWAVPAIRAPPARMAPPALTRPA